MTYNGEPIAPSHFEQRADQSWLNTVTGVGRAVYTLFNVPDHDSSLYEELARVLREEPQPTQAPIKQEVEAVLAGPAQLIDPDKHPRIDGKHLLGHLGLIMQFTSYLPKLQPFGQTPFEHVDNLYSEMTQQGHDVPLGYADQLTIALQQTEGDLPEAMWRLFLTTRQFARWFDSGLIPDMPKFSRGQKMEHMYTFAHSVAACKPHETSPVQDSAGDTYYTWTHALGGLMFDSLAAEQSSAVQLGSKVIHNGTTLMHKLAHKYKPQRLASDHTLAAAYGNAIGDTLVGVLNSSEVAGERAPAIA
ncbi:MAG TPA: hypothetical protein VIM53_01265 [Candidatus Saccharimonadales bacterium]